MAAARTRRTAQAEDGHAFATTGAGRYGVFVASCYSPKAHALRLHDAATTTDDVGTADLAAARAAGTINGEPTVVHVVDFVAGTARKVEGR